jgi:hypothetical protein
MLGVENFCALEIETLEVCSVRELHRREGYYIQKFNSTLNHLVAGRTEKEWLAVNRSKILAQHKAYYETNKTVFLKKCKEYRETHKELIATRKHRYYVKHRGEINERRKHRVICECGGRYCWNNKSIHEKSGKHKMWSQLSDERDL